jgi:tRNA A37 threonylcarbamoyltransferase TsaD
MKRQIKFYTPEEITQIKEFAESKKPINPALVYEFCKKYDRTFSGVNEKIHSYRRRGNKKIAKKVTTKNTIKAELSTSIKDKTAVNMSNGEFKIPINNWSIKSENGQFYFVAQF